MGSKLLGALIGFALIAGTSYATTTVDETPVAEPSTTPEAVPSAAPSLAPEQQQLFQTLNPNIEVPKDVITELILDASGSMKGKIQQRTKLFQAKRVLRSFMMQAHEDNMVLGLRVYGTKPRDCKDSKMVLNFGEKGPEAIDSSMAEIDPKGYGKTPLALSLEGAAADLKRFKDKPRRIVVVTDGVETCGGDPCAVAKKLKQELDIRIFVVGYTLNENERKQLKCLADPEDYFDADDLESLMKALLQLSKKDKNLFVKSPDPLGISELWQVFPDGRKKKVSEFVSRIGTKVEPGVKYEVIVQLDPPFTFHNVVLSPNEKRTLEVKGTGVVRINFFDKLFAVSLLNDQGKTVASFPSDQDTKVPAALYKVKAVSPPFAEAIIDDIMVAPNGFYEEAIQDFGAIEIDPGPGQGLGPFGYYVFDTRKKVDIGSYLTGTPLVLPIGRYTIKSVGNALLKNVYPDVGKLRKIPLPPPGKTVSFVARDEDRKADERDAADKKSGKKPQGPRMLDEMTQDEIQKHFEQEKVKK